MSTQPTLFMTVDQAALACGVSRDTIYRAIRTGRLHAKRLSPTGKHLMRASDLEAWFDTLADA